MEFEECDSLWVAYVLEEARANLTEEAQRRRLALLARTVELFDPLSRELPLGIALPEKDVPIFLAALAARATHLITGDMRHFGPYFGKVIEDVRILTPAEYLKKP